MNSDYIEVIIKIFNLWIFFMVLLGIFIIYSVVIRSRLNEVDLIMVKVLRLFLFFCDVFGMFFRFWIVFIIVKRIFGVEDFSVIRVKLVMVLFYINILILMCFCFLEL